MPAADNIISWLQDFAGLLPWLSVVFAAVVLLAVFVVFLLRIGFT